MNNERKELYKILNEKGKYEVIFIDEYNNFYLVGFFKDLKDSQEEINEYLKNYRLDIDSYELENTCIAQLGKDTILGELEEYPSTFNYCFDKEIYVDGGNVIQIRGFIF